MDTKTLCLGVLTLGDASGYDIRKYLEENFGHFMDISLNSVYPALKVLEKEGLVTFRTVHQENYPDKKVYSLTIDGRSFFTSALQTLPPRHKVRSQLLLLIYFADLLTAERMDEIMAERLQELEHWSSCCREWKSSEKSCTNGIGPEFLVEYAMAMMKAEINFLQDKSSSIIGRLEAHTEEMA